MAIKIIVIELIIIEYLQNSAQQNGENRIYANTVRKMLRAREVREEAKEGNEGEESTNTTLNETK